MANILKIKTKMLHILSYLHIIPIIVRKVKRYAHRYILTIFHIYSGAVSEKIRQPKIIAAGVHSI